MMLIIITLSLNTAHINPRHFVLVWPHPMAWPSVFLTPGGRQSTKALGPKSKLAPSVHVSGAGHCGSRRRRIDRQRGSERAQRANAAAQEELESRRGGGGSPTKASHLRGFFLAFWGRLETPATCRRMTRCVRCWTSWWGRPEMVSREAIRVKTENGILFCVWFW